MFLQIVLCILVMKKRMNKVLGLCNYYDIYLNIASPVLMDHNKLLDYMICLFLDNQVHNLQLVFLLFRCLNDTVIKIK